MTTTSETLLNVADQAAAIAATDAVIEAAKVQVEPPAPYTKREVKLAKSVLEHRIDASINNLVREFERTTGAKFESLTHRSYSSEPTQVSVHVQYEGEWIF